MEMCSNKQRGVASERKMPLLLRKAVLRGFIGLLEMEKDSGNVGLKVGFSKEDSLPEPNGLFSKICL